MTASNAFADQGAGQVGGDLRLTNLKKTVEINGISLNEYSLFLKYGLVSVEGCSRYVFCDRSIPNTLPVAVELIIRQDEVTLDPNGTAHHVRREIEVGPVRLFADANKNVYVLHNDSLINDPLILIGKLEGSYIPTLVKIKGGEYWELSFENPSAFVSVGGELTPEMISKAGPLKISIKLRRGSPR